MADINIQNFGPIEKCELNISETDLIVLTGRQASGKSTIVKNIYFFRSVKELLSESLRKYSMVGDELFKARYYNDFYGYFRTVLRARFLDLFGSSQKMDAAMKIKYVYTKGVYIELSVENKLFDDTGVKIDNYLNISFGRSIYTFLRRIKKPVGSDEIKHLCNEFEQIIDDPYTPYFVPAGRCLMSLLTSQLNFFMLSMDDHQKRMMDYCTLKFIEIISKLKDIFSAGMDIFNSSYVYDKDYGRYTNILEAMSIKMRELLKGEYRIVNGEERLYIDDEEKYIKINYASSGQQEILWILNLLYYIVSSKTKAFIVIEEPESHLYPNAQKTIMELISIVANTGCQIITTTHSPYVLGALNNLKYAAFLADDSAIKDEVYKIIPEGECLKSLDAYYVQNGRISSCLEDMDGELIDNTIIDGASQLINDDLDTLFELYSKLSESEE